MLRKIIQIDKEKCNGCGLCVTACHEDAIVLVDGKATLLRDDYCDGLGNCLPSCPTDAISFIMREALAFDQEAVEVNMKSKGMTFDAAAYEASNQPAPFTCPGSASKTITRQSNPTTETVTTESIPTSQLNQWPVQLKLVPTNAPYFNGANLLIAADCTAFSYGDFHNKFMKNKITLIGCPKLDEGDYAEKLTEILKINNIKSVTVVRMEVPCCGGIVTSVTTALKQSDKMIPWQVVTISTTGEILE